MKGRLIRLKMDQQEDIRDLFSLYSESVFRYAVHILDDVNDAEDAPQEIFIIFSQKWLNAGGCQYKDVDHGNC